MPDHAVRDPGKRLSLSGRLMAGERQIVPPLSLRLIEGQWSTVLGASGAGKTSLLRLIAGLPIGLRFEGEIGAFPRAAVMSQDPVMLPWLTIGANVALGFRLRGMRVAPERIREMLGLCGIGDLYDLPAVKASGGQRQRAALARVLLEDRALVLLDEPFSALDAVMRQRMQDLSARMLRGKTVMMITHDPVEAARLSDHIYILDHNGLNQMTPASGRAPRPLSAPEVMGAAERLLNALLAEEKIGPRS